jgi:hypothetical protein
MSKTIIGKVFVGEDRDGEENTKEGELVFLKNYLIIMLIVN